ncbi:MAG TPA: metallophosphoesterase [Candidatus Limnocylindrales bacterium]|nr:metallophosphoesterase [Candidatus Limnocylindrales bacterium]
MEEERVEDPVEEPRRSLAGNAGLLAIAFFGTLVVLLGLVLGFRGLAAPGASAQASPSTGQPATQQPDASGSVAVTLPPLQTPTPFPSASGDPVLVGAGDIAACNRDGDEATAQLLDTIPGTVFTAGDNAYNNGSAQDFAECYSPSWGRHRDRTRPAAGNHDWGTDNAQGYRDYFGPNALNSDGDTWYSYDLGAWHIVVLDSSCTSVGGCARDSRQGRWLEADLAANDAFCTLAIWHHPRFSSGDEHGSDPTVDPFWRALYAAGADVVINGHDHDYERFAPQDPNGAADRERGIRQFVAGTGGAEIRGFNEPAPHSEVRLAISPGVLKLTLHERSYDWTWIPTNSTVSDSGFAACH